MKLLPVIIILLTTACQSKSPADKEINHSFEFTIETKLSGSPNAVYDQLTGDISPWWDHTFSENPLQLYIEAKPGGGFFEIFDESGDGVRHAVVTAALRGKLLRMEGPLGLAGHALTLVTTCHLSAANDSTHLKVEVNGAGEYKEDWPKVIESVWHHLIIDRFQPYWEAQH